MFPFTARETNPYDPPTFDVLSLFWWIPAAAGVMLLVGRLF
jgi:hypothetical protein